MKPTVGRIVHYVESESPDVQHRAAVVIEVAGDRYPGDAAEFLFLHVFSRAGDYVVHAQRGDEKRRGSWHWPEREGQS